MQRPIHYSWTRVLVHRTTNTLKLLVGQSFCLYGRPPQIIPWSTPACISLITKRNRSGSLIICGGIWALFLESRAYNRYIQHNQHAKPSTQIKKIKFNVCFCTATQQGFGIFIGKNREIGVETLTKLRPSLTK